MIILLDDILDLFSGTIHVTCGGEDIFVGSKDDFWGDFTVRDFMVMNNLEVQDIYVDAIESDDSYGGVDTIHIETSYV